MKCLSLWQPWASVIFEKDDQGRMVKPDETRGWPTAVRGRIAIHAAKHQDKSTRAFYEPKLTMLGMKWSQLPFGCIIGTVDLVRCQPACDVAPAREPWQIVWGDYRQYGDDRKLRYAFVLRDPIKLRNPIPWAGKQSFFDVPTEELRKASSGLLSTEPKYGLFPE
jgi:hypothetical protein